MRGEARSKRGYLYRQQPRLIDMVSYPQIGRGVFDYSTPRVTQVWRGINTKKFKTRKDCLRHGYR